MDYFAAIIGQVLKNEGGYVNNPDDPGGETKFGISKLSYPDLDIANLTIEQATQIYRTDFYNAMNLQGIDSLRVQYYVLDMGVNHGKREGVVTLQRALKIEEDGVLGPGTTAAVNAEPEATLVWQLVYLRVKHYANIVKGRPASVQFLLGWIDRAFTLI